MFLALLSLLALSACGSSPEAGAPPPSGVDVLEYTARLRFDPAVGTLYGRTTLDVRHPDTLGTLPLTLGWSMTARRVKLDGQDVEAERSGEFLYVPLGSGTASQIEITYGGELGEGIVEGEAAGQRVIFAEGWPTHTAGWLPGVHHASDPAHLDLRVVVPQGYSVAASGVPVPFERGVDRGWTGHRFRLTADSPVYTFAWAVADSFTVVEDQTAGGIPVRHHTLAGESIAGLERTPAILDTLVEMLGPYPYEAYATVAVPTAYAGMENAAAPFLKAEYYGGRDPGALDGVNIHEAVHQWFGNDVVPADWAHLWLAEGFATYLSTVVYERLDGERAAREQRVLLAFLSGRDARRVLAPESADDPEATLTPTVYQKGGSVLHLLRLKLGDAVFFEALRQIVRDYADRPLSTVALQTLLEEASGEDLDGVFAYWVYGDRIPTLDTEWEADARTLSWQIENDANTLLGLPFELLVRQDGRDHYVAATEGRIRLSGDERPQVFPVGVLLDIE